MQAEPSDIDRLLQEIDRCNQELRRLESNLEEANQRVNPEPWLRSDQMTISYKNKIQLQRDTYVNQLRSYLEPFNLGLRSSAYPPNNDNGGPKYLAFIDILGFSAIVQNNTHQELQRLVGFLTRDIQIGLVSEEVGDSKSRLYRYGFAPDLSESSINSILLSDTIIFWSKDDSAESFHELVKTIQIFIHSEVYYLNVALRGAITVGIFSYNDVRNSHPQSVVDQSTIYGGAIVEAYGLEKNQEWLGCIVTQEAVERFLSYTPPELMIEEVFNKYLIKYPVPFKRLDSIQEKGKRWMRTAIDWLRSQFGKKSKPVKEDYVIKWPRVWESETGPKAILDCFVRHQKHEELPKRPDVQRKFNNTNKFAEYVIQITKKEQ